MNENDEEAAKELAASMAMHAAVRALVISHPAKAELLKALKYFSQLAADAVSSRPSLQSEQALQFFDAEIAQICVLLQAPRLDRVKHAR